MQKGVSAAPPGNDKCCLLQKGSFSERERNNFRFTQGSRGEGVPPLSWNQSHSPTPAPEPSRSDSPGAVHFTVLWFTEVEQSEKHLISIFKIAFCISFSSNVCLKSCIQKIADFAAGWVLPLHLSGTEDSPKPAEMDKASGLCLPVSRHPGLADTPGVFRGSVQRCKGPKKEERGRSSLQQTSSR